MEDIPDSTLSQEEERKHEQLEEEEEAELELDNLFRRANRNLWGWIFIMIFIVIAGALCVHVFLHPAVDIIRDAAEMAGSAVPK